MPTDAEVDWARRVIAAAAASDGAVQVDGKMVDRPVLLKANAILARQSSQDRTSRA
jgi:citrate lyase subunit beta/citryl-CoA lyase